MDSTDLFLLEIVEQVVAMGILLAAGWALGSGISVSRRGDR